MQYVYVVTAAWVCPLLALHSCNLFVCLSDVFAVTCVLTLHTVSYRLSGPWLPICCEFSD